jgi:hypothetical protein
VRLVEALPWLLLECDRLDIWLEEFFLKQE